MKPFETLTTRGKIRRFGRALEEALSAYSLRAPSIRFVAFESKPVFRVRTETGSFAAKFHEPAEHTLEQMYGETRYLTHISEASDLTVERPLANRRGELVTKVESRWLPDVAHVALFRWLPGKLLDEAMDPDTYGRLGTCTAMLHDASRSFVPPMGFSILRNDRVFYWDEESLLSREDDTLLPATRRKVFKDGARFVQRAIDELWASGSPIVIHNDLHPCNMKVHGGRLALFDFEDITWGFPEQDIGTAMYHVRFRDDYASLLDAFRRGYEEVRGWPFTSDRELDLHAAARVLMFANYVLNYDIRPAKWLPEFEVKIAELISQPREG